MDFEIGNEVRSFKKLLGLMKPYLKNEQDLSKNIDRLLQEKSVEGCELSLLPVEIWGNWLLCAVLRKNISGKITFEDGSKKAGYIGDGIIFDKRDRDNFSLETEHVSGLDNRFSKEKQSKGTDRVIEAAKRKLNKYSDDYERSLTLVVFFDGAEEWYRNKFREFINGKQCMQQIYLISLFDINNEGYYAYTVTELFENDSITYKVQINPDFTHWSVSLIP